MHPADKSHKESRTIGQLTADAIADWVGSWPFIIIQSVILAIWVAINTVWWFHPHFDPAPYIGLNLLLSFQAAYTGPILLISSNRQAQRDRLLAKHDYEINLQALERLEQLAERLERDASLWECRQCPLKKEGPIKVPPDASPR